MAGYRLVQNSDVTTNPAVTAFTIGFWMRTDNTCSQGVSNGGTVIGNKNYTTGGNAGLAIGLFGSCEIRFNVGTGSARADSNGYSLSAGQWAYVAVVIDKAALTMKGYVMDPVRGIQTNSTAITSALVDKLGGLGNGLGLNEDGTGLYYQRENLFAARRHGLRRLRDLEPLAHERRADQHLQVGHAAVDAALTPITPEPQDNNDSRGSNHASSNLLARRLVPALVLACALSACGGSGGGGGFVGGTPTPPTTPTQPDTGVAPVKSCAP